MSLISIAVLCSVFSEPSFYMNESRQAGVCSVLPVVLQEAEKNNVDPFLLMGLITVESNWNPKAESWANACGLTQVVPKWTGGRATKGKKYSCSELKNPETSIEAGSRILSWWVNSYAAGNVPTGLCGYYSGFTCKPRIHQKGKNYYTKVLKYKKKIKSLYFSKLNAENTER
mgnify:CR=1 FL=1